MLDLKKTLTDIAMALVDEPDKVVVTVKNETDKSIVLELSVSPDDMGKVIGRHGKIAKAIRSVIKAAANADDRKVTVDIV
ncbi:MAG: KH domain-containing protein [Clostridia bacterium]|jgi:predicted RNA-binding protein YlqC (UPF0109 family)|nr:KH domain-containing protein [Clostridia bacterium]